MTDKDIKFYKDKGFSQSIIDQTIEFLKLNNGELVNLAYLGEGDTRIIFKDLKTQKVEAQIVRFKNI
jgi:hypothetical protein